MLLISLFFVWYKSFFVLIQSLQSYKAQTLHQRKYFILKEDTGPELPENICGPGYFSHTCIHNDCRCSNNNFLRKFMFQIFLEA